MYILILFPVVLCFEISLSGRRDAGFFIFGQLCQFIHKLCMRCLAAKCIPKSTEWYDLLSLNVEEKQVLLPSDFLQRLKLDAKVDAVMRRQAAQDLSDLKSDRAKVDKHADELRQDFCVKARNYLLLLIEGMRRHVTMSTNNVRGMACFDPRVLFTQPLEFADRCFTDLFRGFKLRGWFPGKSEQLCRDEYMAFLSDLRSSDATVAGSPDVIHDIVSYLVSLPALKSRPHIYHLFKLSCLCLTDVSKELPIVKSGGIDTSNLQCTMNNVILPVQSFLSNVPGSVDVCSSDSSLADFQRLCVDYGSYGLILNHDPWKEVDFFGRDKIHKSLSACHKKVLEKRSKPAVRVTSASRATASTLSPIRAPKRPRFSDLAGNFSKSDTEDCPASSSSVPAKLKQGCSKE